MAHEVTIDFETRSKIDLKAAGQDRYAADPSTEIMCMAVKVDEQSSKIWIARKFMDKLGSAALAQLEGRLLTFPEALDLIMTADLIHAHNAGFELAIWEHQLFKKHKDISMLPLHKVRCSAAAAAAMALPRHLAGVCKAVKAPIEKDAKGHSLMLKMCKPQKGLKYKDQDPKKKYWIEDEWSIVALAEYCMQDVDSEHAATKFLRPLSEEEQGLWVIDQLINTRGIHFDSPGADILVGLWAKYKEELFARFKALAPEGINTPGQQAKIIEWFREAFNFNLKNFQKKTVAAVLLRSDLHPTVREALQLRVSTSKTSIQKLDAMKAREDVDHRLRGTMMYNGAGPGRWAGKGIQPHNFPRNCYKPHEVDTILKVAKSSGIDGLDLRYGDPAAVMSKCLRGLLTAALGKKLISADYSNIEGRALAWLAGEEYVLEEFRAQDDGTGTDRYILIAANAIFKKQLKEILDDERQVGKVTELSCGYNGGWHALMQMCLSYGVTPPDDVELSKESWFDYDGKSRLTLDEARYKAWGMPIVKAWRESRPATVGLWKGLGTTAMEAIRDKGVVKQCRGIYYQVVRIGHIEYLVCMLPSGRKIYYAEPVIRKQRAVWGDIVDCITFMGVDPKTKQWTLLSTYGGKLTENVVQAIARDMLAEGIRNVEKANYPVVLHVHDEAVSEVDEDFGSVEEYERLMSIKPTWLGDCPIVAEGWEGKRYQK
jgi:DNA polymerase